MQIPFHFILSLSTVLKIHCIKLDWSLRQTRPKPFPQIASFESPVQRFAAKYLFTFHNWHQKNKIK